MPAVYCAEIRFMKHFVFGGLAILLSFSAKAQLMLKNTKSDTMQVAVAMQSDDKDFKGWISKGWYKINPGDSGAVGNLVGPVVYYFVQTTNNKTTAGGTKPFLVDPKDPFTIKDPGAKKTAEASRTYEFRKFYEIKVPAKAQKDGKLMILL